MRENLLQLGAIRPGLPIVYLTDVLARQTAERLDSFVNREPAESLVYWFGFELGSRAVVTTLIVADALVAPAPADVARAPAVAGTPLVMLGLARSAPGSDVGRAAAGRACSDLAPGLLVVVVPHAGRRGLALRECGVYRQNGGKLRQILPATLPAHIRIVPGHADLRSATTSTAREEIRNIAVY